jgi:peptidoglycan/xylan/chitin deacetylase (PgdA/CDA1 family)
MSANVPGPKQDYVGYGPVPPRVRWPNDAKVAVSIVVNYEAGSERSLAHGDAESEHLLEFQSPVPHNIRDLGAESIHEYESRAGIWRTLRLFDEEDVKTTFFTTAVALEANPAVGEAIREGGHEPCFHGYRWEEPWTYSEEEERDHVHRSLDVFARLAGERPYGCYWRYAPSTSTRRILVDEGFLYDSNAYNDDLPYFVDVEGKQLLVVPYSLTYNDGKFVMASGQGYSSPADFVDYCTRAVDELWREGDRGYPKMMSIGLHPRWIGQAGRLSGLREFIDHCKQKGDVWFGRRIDIARWWIGHSDEFQRG